MEFKQFKNVCVYGLGGVGGFFGGLMAHEREIGGERPEVSFIARGNHLEAIKAQGLILNADHREGLRCIPDFVESELSLVPTPDLCLVCVKSYDLEAVALELQKHIDENTVVIPLLNGVDIYERLRASLTRGIVLPACVYIASYVEKPGMVTQKGPAGKIIVGPDPQRIDFDAEGLIHLLKDQMGFDFHWQDDPYPAIWTKYVLVASFALVTAMSNKSFGEVVDDPALKQSVEEIMQEIILIGQQKGIKLEPDLIEKTIQNVRRFPHEAKTSYQRDVEILGKKNEGDIFGETILRLGKEYHVNTPVSQRVFSTIRQ